MLDAHIALMQESNVPFNGASNDSGSGRARSADQRNLLSYMRGMTGRTPNADGVVREKMLRGDGSATWSALAATFAHTDGTRHTGLRIFYAPATATASSQIGTTFAQLPSEFSLADLEPYAAERFNRRRLRAAIPTMALYDSFAQWAAALHTRLGIGRDGDGTPAMRLLARIQAGRTITSVDNLYKDMVLERPATYDAADRAVEHFGQLEQAHEEMRTAEAQVAELESATELHAKLVAAQTELDLLDTFRLDAGQASPVALWAARLEKTLIEGEIDQARELKKAAKRQHTQAQADLLRLNGELLTNREQQAANGGDALARCEQEIAERTAQLESVQLARGAFAPQAPSVDLPTSQADLTVLQQEAQAFLDPTPRSTRSSPRCSAPGPPACAPGASRWPAAPRRRPGALRCRLR